MSDESASPRSGTRLPHFDAARQVFNVLEKHSAAGEADWPPEIGGYLVEGQIGTGGGGVVYRGLKPGSDRAVAIKLLNAALGSSPGARRALRELDLLLQVRLPCVPQLLDYGEHEGRVFFVTDLVEGETIAEHCTRGRLDRRARGELLATVADAVHCLHEQGVIHRDIKPDNILIDRAGRPVIVDLGIATLVTGDAVQTLTAEGVPIGSPATMAPEQARGDRAAISIRTDVYGLGATAYVVLTGEPPHDMNTTIHEAIRRVAQDEPRSARALDPSMPGPLVAVLRKAVSRNPDQRYRSADALAEDLRRWLNREPVVAQRPSAWSAVLRWVERHPVLATGGVTTAVGASVLLLTLGSIWRLRMAPYDVELSSDHQEARLISVAGAILHRWRVERGHINSAELQDAPWAPGGKIALLAFDADVSDESLRGSLSAFSVRDPDTPLWQARIEESDVERSPLETKYTAANFHTANAALDDIFPGPPGPEIVAIHKDGPWTATAIRVYDLHGSVLCQWWHDGVVNPGYWMAGPGLLLFTGLNCEARWEERGWDGITEAYPVVAFAIEPRQGHVATTWTTPAQGVDPTMRWYHCVLPPSASDVFSGAEVGPPHSHEDHDWVARFTLRRHRNNAASISWLIDKYGRLDPESLVVSDTYARDEDALDPDRFTLGDVPPVRGEPDP